MFPYNRGQIVKLVRLKYDGVKACLTQNTVWQTVPIRYTRLYTG